MKKDIKKAAGAGLLSLGLVVGLAGFAGAASIGTTGPDSDNEITYESDVEYDFENRNDVELDNDNEQRAYSGEVEVEGNTEGGDAESGNASNANSLSATIELDNSQASTAWGGTGMGSGDVDATIDTTGPDSNNEVRYENRMEVNVDNDNDINIDNNNEQSARSGDAEVRNNTTGGSATSGNVSNTSTSSFTVRVTN